MILIQDKGFTSSIVVPDKLIHHARVVISGTSSKRRCRYFGYFVHMAHPVTFEIAPKHKKVKIKGRYLWLL